MRQPRRVPWASRAELVELYDLVYSSGNEGWDRALSRMSVYISSPSCPAFIHLLHTLLGALAQPYPPANSRDAHAQRMVYAMALVRFVNGMVDPLQTGGFARPISHLAAQLGLPPGLVALRHRATHEDLPSLGHLRGAAEEALSWVHGASFVPLLNDGAEAGWDRRARSEALVARWKKVMKARTRARDVSAESESGRALRRLYRDIDVEDTDDLLDAVVRTGLVPVARRKRPSKSATAPPADALAVWTPLLAHLAAARDDLPSALAQTIASVLVDTAPRHRTVPSPTTDADDAREVASYRWTLGTWLAYLWRSDEMPVPADVRRAVLVQLARELLHHDNVLMRVYRLLDAEGLAALEPLLPPAETDDADDLQGLDVPHADVDVDATLAKMESNLAALEDKLRHNVQAAHEDNVAAEVPGWRQADDAWRPCPIGIWA